MLYAHCAAASPEEAPYVPKSLTYSITGLPMPQTHTYVVTPSASIVQIDEELKAERTKRSVQLRRITTVGWKEFEKSVAKLNIWNWKSNYRPKGVIFDGYHWSLTMSEGVRAIHSGGGNAGPAPSDPRRTITIGDGTSGDALLGQALQTLWEHSLR